MEFHVHVVRSARRWVSAMSFPARGPRVRRGVSVLASMLAVDKSRWRFVAVRINVRPNVRPSSTAQVRSHGGLPGIVELAGSEGKG